MEGQTMPIPDHLAGRLVDFIDVSAHQGAIDWAAVPVPAIVKATEGRTFTDRRFAENLAGAIGAGKLFGVYHFLTSTSDGAAQATHFLNTVGFRSLVYVLDWETDTTGTLPSEAIAQEFVDNFRRDAHDCTLVVYGTEHRRAFAERNALPFWCAWYPFGPKALAAVAQELRSAGTWAWQWSSDGNVPGIAGRVDVNTFFATPPTMEGQTMTITNEDVELLGLARVRSRDYGDDGRFSETEPLGATQLAAFAHIEAQLAALSAEKAAAAADRASATADTVAVLVAQLQRDVATLVAPPAAAVDPDALKAAVIAALRELLA